ncbi:MAG: glycosyltransferase [Candidatus Omnitrophica bacterium]|nr:glycosyltransferase [Candidatus Omnitrophota bacterium]
MSDIEISVVIPVKNQERYLDRVLKKVFSQNINSKIEVIIIDSGSQDSTLEIARKYPVKIIEIPTEEFGHGRTRNHGAQIANGATVVFLNADAIPRDENWLNCLVYNFKGSEKIAGVYSRIYPQADCNPLHSWEILNDTAYSHNKREVKYIENFDNYRYMKPRDKRRLLAFQTISCAIRKDILLKYPFKNMEFGEDLEWSKRIMEKGFKIVYDPESVVLHSHNFYFSFIKTFKKYFDDAKLNKQLLNIWPWYNFPILIGHIIFKVSKDIRYVLSLNKKTSYKISWLFYSPFIRLAELFGIILGANSQYLSPRVHLVFSLVSEIKKN